MGRPLPSKHPSRGGSVRRGRGRRRGGGRRRRRPPLRLGPAPASPPGRRAGGVRFLGCTGGWGWGRQSWGGRQKGGKESRGPKRGVRGGRGKHTHAPGLGLDTRTLGPRDTPPSPSPSRWGSAQSGRTGRVQGARALTLTRATLRLPVRAEPRERPASPRRRWRRQRSSNKSSERLPEPGRRSHGSRSSAGPGCARSTRGGGGGGGMWPLPPIHKSSAGHRWQAGRSGERRSGGRVMRRARRQKENKRARQSEPRVLRPRLGSGGELRWAGRCAAGAAPGRGGLRRGVLLGANPRGRGSSREQGSGHWRRSLPRGGREAKDTCRLPGLRRAGASAQRPGAWLLRSGGGAGSHAIHASAHLRAGRWPWPAAGGGREVPRGGSCLHASGLRLGGSQFPSGLRSERHSPLAPFPPGSASPGRALRGAGWAGRGAGPNRSMQGPGGRGALPFSAEPSQARRVTHPRPARRCRAPPPPSPPAPFGPAPRLPHARSSSHCSPDDTGALTTPDL